MRGRLIDLAFSLNRKQRVTVELDGDFRDSFDKLKTADVKVEIVKYRERRSLNANSYFHLLVNKIAENQGLGNDEVKTHLVVEYGALAKDADGVTVGFKLPASVDVRTLYRYVKCFDTRIENGKEFNCYMVYKETHLLDTKEMARLIDGAVSEAKELGIETDTPEQIARYKELWNERKMD